MTCFTFSAMLYCVCIEFAVCYMVCMFQLKYNLCSEFQPFFCSILAGCRNYSVHIACVRQSMNRNHKKHTLTVLCCVYITASRYIDLTSATIVSIELKWEEKIKKNGAKKVGSIENRRSFDSLTTVRAFLSTFLCVLAIHCAKHGILPWHVCTLCACVCAAVYNVAYKPSSECRVKGEKRERENY